MFSWFRTRRKETASATKRVVDPALRSGVDVMVAFVQTSPETDDDGMVRYLTERGVPEPQATKLVQFVPIAFTRFLYRSSGVKFAQNYVLLGSDGQPKSQHQVAEEPAFREAWEHCEDAAVRSVGEKYFVLVAARSGGYRALQDLLRQGSNLDGVITGPPMMFG